MSIQLDAILVLWGYVLPKVKGESWKVLFKGPTAEEEPLRPGAVALQTQPDLDPAGTSDIRPSNASVKRELDDEEHEPKMELPEVIAGDKPAAIPAAYSQLSIALTIVSIAVAFAISIVSYRALRTLRLTPTL